MGLSPTRAIVGAPLRAASVSAGAEADAVVRYDDGATHLGLAAERVGAAASISDPASTRPTMAAVVGPWWAHRVTETTTLPPVSEEYAVPAGLAACAPSTAVLTMIDSKRARVDLADGGRVSPGI